MKSELLEVKGIITLILPNAMFRVKLDGGDKVILCYLCGRMNKRFIKLTVGDAVLVEMSPVDTEKGRITRRF